MKHHDSIGQADKKLALAVEQLRLWQLPATPINYAVTYEYITQKNQALFSAIKQQVSSGKLLDNFFMEEIYQQYVLGQHAFREEIITDLDDLANSVTQHTAKSGKTTEVFLNKLDTNISTIGSGDKRQINIALSRLKKDSTEFKLEQQKYAEQLKRSQRQATNLRAELEEVRKELYFDSLTQLYNRKAMTQHLELWHSENPNKQVAALVINIDHFSKFCQRFGPLIGDILLSKIAGKIGSYVDNSGLPVRSGGDEFLILLPDIESSIAKEIAEKIRQGVEKLRFISNKSGIKLPQVTVSIGVSQFKITKNASAIIKHTRQILHDHDVDLENTVISA